MSEPFIGEIRLFPYDFAPRGWAFCHGQLLSIVQNTSLFALLGTTLTAALAQDTTGDIAADPAMIAPAEDDDDFPSGLLGLLGGARLRTPRGDADLARGPPLPRSHLRAGAWQGLRGQESGDPRGAR